jgi:endonuclease-3
MRKNERYKKVVENLENYFPQATTELFYENTFQLLVAVILSAQCTDKRVNIVTPNLFKKYPIPEYMAKADIEDIFQYIKSISYPNSKAKYLSQMSKRLVETYHSVVPSDVKELQTLSGVGRKTANVIASVVFHQAKMPVDTHVHRVSRRIGLTIKAKTVLQTEEQLMSNLKEKDIALIHHQLILLGRYICKARKPECDKCPLVDCCKYYQSKKS